MATVTVSGLVIDETGRKDSRDWTVFSPVYREGASGEVVTMRRQTVRVVAGIFTAKLEPGPCFIQNPDGDRWLVTVPDTDTELWPLIAAAVAIPPGTPVDELNAAVAAYFDANPIPTGPEGPPNVLEIGTVVSGATAGATITGTSPAQVLNLTLPKGDTGDTGPTADWSTISGKPAVVAAGADAAAARGVISAQAADSDLTAIAGLSPANDDVVQRKSGAWTNRTPAQLKTDLALVKGDVGLGNADNTSDANKPISTATQTALDTKQATSEKNQANGYAGLDSGGLVPAALLPSYVDDVLEYANTGAFPATGEAGKIYTATSTGKIYRWGGSAYAEISPSPGSTDAVTEGAANLYYTNARADARIAAALGVSVQAYSAVLAALSGKTSPAGQLVGTTDTQTLTGKTISGSSNTLSNIGMAALSATGTPNSGNFLRGDGTWAASSSIAPDFGTYASRPAPSAAGKIYYCTDIDKVYRDSGAAWQLVSDGVGPIIGEPPTTGWSTNTLGGSTVVADKGGYLFTSSGAGASPTLRCQLRAFASGQTATFHIQPNLPMLNNAAVFITVSDGTKFVIFYWQVNGSGVQAYACSKFNTATSWNSDYLAAQGGSWAQLMSAQWMRVRDDGTNRNFELSVNGLDWTLFHQHSRTDFLTATQVGWGLNDSVNRAFTARLRQCTVE